MTNQPPLTIEELQLFSADDAVHLFMHPLNRTVLYTPGVRYLMRRAEAYWLIDAVVSYFVSSVMHQAIVADDRLAAFQVWQLDVADDRTATLTCRADRDDAPVITQDIDYTDFPLPQIKLWAVCDDQQWTLMLPSEY